VQRVGQPDDEALVRGPRTAGGFAIMRDSTRGLRATVRNSFSGGAPRMTTSNAAWTSGA